MATRGVGLLKSAAASVKGKGDCGGIKRWAHAMAQSSPLQTTMSTASPPMILPENQENDLFDFPFSSFIPGGTHMELMAVPKKKISKSRRGIRNGPKALKPVPVIIRCTVCGRVKLPHFYCCSGIKQNPDEQSG